ncbi:MAG: cadherin-like domain-containing protein, partial [Acidimicrobiia bacterium]
MGRRLQKRVRRGTTFAVLALLALGLMVSMSGTALASILGEAETPDATAPAIVSDKADYAPGELVTLTGWNWQPGETVHIDVNDDVGMTWSRNADVVADDGGNISDQFNLPNWFVANYTVRATGDLSGSASATFTDSNVKASADLPAADGWTFTKTVYVGTTGKDGVPNTTCAGSLLGTNVPLTGTNQETIGGVGTNDSVKLTASSPSTNGATFSHWSGPAGSFTSGLATICVAGTSGTDEYVAHYTAPANSAPTATSQSVSTNEDASKLITLAGTDSDSNPLTFKITALPSQGDLYMGNSTTLADKITTTTTTLIGNTVTYVPALDYNGPDSFQFKVNDGTVDSAAAATVNVTVTEVNDAPSATADDKETAEDTDLVFAAATLTANDSTG